MLVQTITDVTSALSRGLHQNLSTNHITNLGGSGEDHVAELLDRAQLVESGLLHILKRNIVEEAHLAVLAFDAHLEVAQKAGVFIGLVSHREVKSDVALVHLRERYATVVLELVASNALKGQLDAAIFNEFDGGVFVNVSIDEPNHAASLQPLGAHGFKVIVSEVLEGLGKDRTFFCVDLEDG